MEIEFELNEEQRKAVLEKHNRICVVAGPGCGKTRTLVGKFISILKKEEVPINKILVLTFAKKAAKEIRERVKKNIFYKNIHELDKNISNFHSFCFDFLKDFYDSDFLIYDSYDQKKIIGNILSREKKNDEKIEKEEINYFHTKINNLKVREFCDKKKNSSEVYHIYKIYERYLHDNKAMDFNDLLIITLKLLINNENLRNIYKEKFTHILLDEFQDINTIQWKIIKEITDDKSKIFLVGDPNQAIYGFQGSNPDLMLELIKNKEWKIFYLDKNYRSTKKIVDISNSFIEKNKNCLINNRLKSEINIEGKKIVFFCNYNFSWYIIKESIKLRREENIKFDQIAILYRNNYLSENLEKELISWKISYEKLGSFNFIERREIKDLIIIIRSVIYKDDISLLNLIMFQDNIGKTTIEKIRKECLLNSSNVWDYLNGNNEFIGIKKKQGELIKEFTRKICKLEEDINEGKNNEADIILIRMINNLDYWVYAKKRYKKDINRRERNIEKFLIFFQEYSKKNLFDIKEKFRNFLQFIVMNFDNKEIINEENIKESMILSSIHQAKGLEFKVVFIICFDKDIIPSKNSEDILEEKRLFYVGITRAKERLYLITKKEKSIFLDDLDKNLLKILN